MKFNLLIIFLFILVIYLNRSYAYFYNYIGDKNLPQSASREYEIGENPLANPKIPNKGFIKMVSLGDSLTAGVGAKGSWNNYPVIIGQKLNKTGPIVELDNFADPGAASQNLLNFQLDLAISENPDLVTILIGINDMHNFVSLSKFQDNYQSIIDQLKAKTHAKVVLINIPMLGGKKILFFPYNLWFDYRTRQFNKVIKSLAEKNNLKYIDLYSLTKERFEKDESLYSEDNFHPSVKGYQLWGQVINAN